jgi:hypothetical protein
MNATFRRSTTRWLLLSACVIAAALGSIALLASGADDDSASSRLPLKQVADVALGGRTTRLDYASYDPERQLLIWATAR